MMDETKDLFQRRSSTVSAWRMTQHVSSHVQGTVVRAGLQSLIIFHMYAILREYTDALGKVIF